MSQSRPKVVVTNGEVPDEAIQLLKEKCDVQLCPELPLPSRADILQRLPGAAAVMWVTKYRLDDEALSAAGAGLRVVSTMSAGYDNVDVEAARRRGVRLGHTPGVLADAVAEVALMLTLAAMRRLTAGQRAMQRGEWVPGRPSWLLGVGLSGATVGIVGLGGVGAALARRVLALGAARVLYAAPRPSANAAAVAAQRVPMEQLLGESDAVVACCPLNSGTRGLMGAEAFAKMKPSAVFVNVSRGEVVDQEALVSALREGRLLGAGLDVMTPEPLPPTHDLLALDNCVLSAHIGSATVVTRRDMALLAARNILAGLSGEALPAPIPGSEV